MNNTILHIITSLHKGGAQNTLANICMYDLKSKHVVISLTGTEYWANKLREHGVTVIELELRNRNRILTNLFTIIKLLRSHRPIAVQTWMYHADLIGGVLAKLTGHNNIIWNIRHSDLKRGVNPLMTLLIMRLCVILSYCVPRQIVCCASKARDVHKRYGYSSKKMIVITNGIDRNKFFPDGSKRIAYRHSLSLKDDTILMASVARYNRQKGHDILLQAFDKLSRDVDVKLLLVGDGMISNNIELSNLINKLTRAQDVILCGPSTDVPSILQASDIHVLASISGEGYPNVVAEAAACGLYNVVTDVGDAVQIIGQDGASCLPHDIDGLSEKLSQAINTTQTSQKPTAILKGQNILSIPDMINCYQRLWFL